MKSKSLSITIIIVALGIGGSMVFSGSRNQNTVIEQNINNVIEVDGKQIITITAKGGYLPKVTLAKAGMPTVLKISTKGTFDCSSSIVIPSLGYKNNLPPSGETLIDVPSQNAGSKLRGLCAMGMYSFEVNFN